MYVRTSRAGDGAPALDTGPRQAVKANFAVRHARQRGCADHGGKVLMMGDERKQWESPEIVEVGGVDENTGLGNENVRDNPGDATPAYSDPNRSEEARSEVTLPEGE
jgi:hypothetical protein